MFEDLQLLGGHLGQVLLDELGERSHIRASLLARHALREHEVVGVVAHTLANPVHGLVVGDCHTCSRLHRLVVRCEDRLSGTFDAVRSAQRGDAQFLHDGVG